MRCSVTCLWHNLRLKEYVVIMSRNIANLNKSGSCKMFLQISEFVIILPRDAYRPPIYNLEVATGIPSLAVLWFVPVTL